MHRTFRFLVLVLALLLTCGQPLGAFAQASGPDPNSPVGNPTPDTGGTGASPDSGLPAVDNPTYTLTNEKYDLAAVTLDQSEMPSAFGEYGEFHVSVDELKSRYAGQIDPKEIDIAGFNDYYLSAFFDGKDNTIKVTAISFNTEAGVRAGFALLQDNDLLFPNGTLTVDPALDGVGRAPGAVTSGYLENGDGTETRIYSVQFRVGSLLLSVEMDSDNGAEPDSSVIDDLAHVLAGRAEDVLDGNEIDGVTYGLGGLIVYPTDMVALFDGYALSDEDFLLRTMNEAPNGFESSYSVTYRMSQRADNPYPIYSMTLAQFDSQRDLADAFQSPESLMYQYPGIEQIDDPSIDGADGAAAFTYSVNEEVDSVRVFAQAGAFLIIVDIEGSPALDDAITIATAYAQANVACVADGECAAPRGLPGQDESTPTPTDFFGAGAIWRREI